MEATVAQGVAARPFAGLYEFVKTHLVVVNGIVLASTTFVGTMDFIAPRLSVVPTVVYSATGFVVLPMLAAALAPARIGRLLGPFGFVGRGDAAPSLWRRPAWQFSVAILLAVTVLGFASVARASEGGIIAAKFPEARRLQESLLAHGRDTADIRRGVGEANGKLDLLVADARDPQKELTAKGYANSSGGLATAVARGDGVAVGLFIKSGFKVGGEGPMAALLGGAWHAEIAASLPTSMFENPTACSAGLFRWEVKEPALARIAPIQAPVRAKPGHRGDRRRERAGCDVRARGRCGGAESGGPQARAGGASALAGLRFWAAGSGSGAGQMDAGVEHLFYIFCYIPTASA